MVNYVTVNVDTTALFQPKQRAYGVVGIVGYGISGTDDSPEKFVTQTAVDAEFGEDSAIAKSAALAFQNGAKEIWCVKATSAASTDDNTNKVASAGQTVFTLTVTNGYPCQGSVNVNVNDVSKTEGTDFYVDYGNAQVIFYSGLQSGDDVDITFDVISAANMQSALDSIENRAINIVVLAMTYEPAVLAELKDSVNAASASGYERVGVFMMPNGNSSGAWNSVTVVGSGGSMEGEERMTCFASTSVEDTAAACAGIIARYEPWISILLKAVSGIAALRAWTATEEAALIALQVNHVHHPEMISGSGLYTGEGFTLASDNTKKYLDVVRVIDDIVFRLKAGLTNPNVIGKIRIDSAGMKQLKGFIKSIMAPRVREGEITAYAINIPIQALLDIPLASRTTAESAEINTVKASRTVEVDVSIEYSAAIHYLTVNLKFV